MSSRTSNLIILIIFGGIIIYQTLYLKNSTDALTQNIVNIAINIVSGVLLFLILKVLNNYSRLKLYILTHTVYLRKDIRVSFAYLIRIKIDDKYLLVKSRTTENFQLVGGAYKTLPGSELALNRLGVKRDRLISTENGIATGDLRVIVNAVNVIPLIKWFESKKNRETSPWREFCEELISTSILPWQPFRYIDYNYVGTVTTDIKQLRSGDLGMYVHEVYDLLINDEQKVIFKELLSKGNTEKVSWATEYLINRLGHDEATKEYVLAIADHTKWALAVK